MKWIHQIKKAAQRESFPFLIQIYGAKKIVFEACQRILEYSEESIVLEGEARVRVNGKSLRLLELGGGTLAAVGELESIVFEHEKTGG